MKKFTIVFCALVFALVSLAGFATNTDGFVIGAGVPLDTGEQFQLYIGYAGESNPYLVTFSKDGLDSWTGIYSVGAFQEWYFTPRVNVRAGVELGLDFQSEGTYFDSASLLGGIVFKPFKWLGVGVFMGYDGTFMPQVNFEIYPSGFDVEIDTGE